MRSRKTSITLKIISVLLILYSAYALWLSPQLKAQGISTDNGCPATSPAGFKTSYEVIEAIEVAPALPEVSVVNGLASGTFYQQQIAVQWQPGLRGILASSPNGGLLCVDDYFELRAHPSGRMMKHDFRDAAISRIIPIPNLDITFILREGVNQLDLALIDLTGPNYSSSPIYLLLVVDPVTPSPTKTATPTATATATITPTFTPSPSPTLQPTHTPTLSPTVTPTEETITGTLKTHETTHDDSSLSPTPGLWPLWLILGLVLIGSVIVGWVRKANHEPALVGSLEIRDADGQFIRELNLADFGQQATIGYRQGDIILPAPDEQVGTDIVGILKYQQNASGPPQVVIERLDNHDPDRPAHAYPLHNGDEIEIGSSILTYTVFTIDQGEDDIIV